MRILVACPLIAALAAVSAPPQQPVSNPSRLDESGQIVVAGHSTSYLIRHLPVSSFPELPNGVQMQLNKRGCVIPQTYEAHRPENVIHGSFEQPGSSDWAALCSAQGTVSLLVFFSSAPEEPSTVATSPETQHLQIHDLTGVLGFNWGIDPATPEQVRQAQAGMEPRPPRLTHDAIAEAIVEHRTVYHYYAKSAWTQVDTGN